jgi:glycosyltransferase involved in cell wall biosynthesis
MALCVPPIVTDTGGSAELIEEGISGFVVPPNDAHAIARRIEDLWRDPEAARAIGQAARERIAGHFNVTATVEKTRAFFRQWVEEKTVSECRKNR